MAGGAWAVTTITLKQKFQTFTGTMRRGKVVTPITDGKLNGNEITFTAGGTEYTGKVNGTQDRGRHQVRREMERESARERASHESERPLREACGWRQLACLAIGLAQPAARAQPAQAPAKPLVGQPGKDAIWVPTRRRPDRR